MTNYKTISIELTKWCNLDCLFCYSRCPSDIIYDELSYDSFCDFLMKWKNNGGERVLFTGGEVFLRNDFFDLLYYAKSLDLVVDVFSNGTLIDDNSAGLLGKYINLINVSLDGPKEFHDHYRKSIGSYEKTLEGLQNLSNHNVHFALQCMITPDNYQNTAWLIDIVKRLKPVMVKLGHVSKMGRGKEAADLWLSERQIEKIKQYASEISEKSGNFHTRVITNIINHQEFERYYPTFDGIVTPWMLPDGRIIGCYVHKDINDWVVSDYSKYPSYNQKVLKRINALEKKLYMTAKTLPYFDLLELTATVAENFDEQVNCDE